LFAIQSRALGHPEREHPTLTAMSVDYATLVQSVRGRGPYRLLGWSMGGIIAQAVAVELERRGADVTMVGMIDPIVGVGARRSWASRRDSTAALVALIHAFNPLAISPEWLGAHIRVMSAQSASDDRLLAWCEEHGFIASGTLSLDQFSAALRLYQRHLQLVRAQRPSMIAATVWRWWAKPPSSQRGSLTGSEPAAREKIIGGDHFSIMRPPYIEAIAADIVSQNSQPLHAA
jgi:thioesterase domain-containing protein